MRRRRDSSEITFAPIQRASTREHEKLQLVVIAGDKLAAHRLPASGVVRIGRATANDIVIDDPSVSRAHAILTIDSPLRVSDLGSSAGTFVDGRALEPKTELAIECGKPIELGGVTVVVQRLSAASPPRRVWPHDHFEGRIDEECARCARTGGHFSILRVNARPREVALEIFRDALRAHDVLATYAPDEYEILVDAEPDDAGEILRRISAALYSKNIAAHTALASYPRDGVTSGALLSHANAGARGVTPVEEPSPSERPMDGLRALVERVAASTISVLIFGETGVGKEVLAERLHRFSPRADKTFLRLNCAALSETLLESELFGHERGAFTGAVASKPGLLESANGGTVFLDEIGDLPLSMQVKLLRVIEERKVTRVGSVHPRAIDVRFVSATHRDLEQETVRGTFRSDLFFRLNGFTIAVPPLRERQDEIAGLARTFAAQALGDKSRRVPDIAPDALALLMRYGWPGNIRELRNVIERAVLLSGGGSVTAKHLPLEKMLALSVPKRRPAEPVPRSQTPPAFDAIDEEPTRTSTVVPRPTSSLRSDVEDLERTRIVDALERCLWNQSRAARLLGISRNTLMARLDAFEIARPRKGRET